MATYAIARETNQITINDFVDDNPGPYDVYADVLNDILVIKAQDGGYRAEIRLSNGDSASVNGTPFSGTTSELRTLLLTDVFTSGAPGGGSAFEEVTYASLLTAISGATLTPGAIYKITDRGDRGLFFHAISSSQLSKEGTRLMLCPAWYGTGTVDGNTWIGVWNSGKTVNAGELAIWGGRVWENQTGAIGTATDFDVLDNTNWAAVTKTSFSNGEYVEKVLGVSYDVVNDWIEKQWDGHGNVLGLDYAGFQDIDGSAYNYVDVTDWNFNENGDGYSMYNNTCHGVFNNSNVGNISMNSNNGKVSNNKNLGPISRNKNHGDIRDNTNGDEIMNNSNKGHITGNSCTGYISQNSNSGQISGNSNLGYIYNNLNNGPISNIGSANANITNNLNNGGITTTTTGDISDATVSK